jgi:hypothetical protein
MSTIYAFLQKHKSLCFAFILSVMAFPMRAEMLASTIFDTKQSYCFSEIDDTSAENLLNGLVRVKKADGIPMSKRNILLFGKLIEIGKSAMLDLDDFSSYQPFSDLQQLYLRMGLMQIMEIGGEKRIQFSIRFRIDLVIYKCTFSEDNFSQKVSLLTFPKSATHSTGSDGYPLCFFGKGFPYDNLWDDTKESRGSGLHVRSLPFGVRLLSSSHPKIIHGNELVTCCYIPVFQGQESQETESMLIQTIHLFPPNIKTIPLLATPDSLIKGLMSDYYTSATSESEERKNALILLQAAQTVQEIVSAQSRQSSSSPKSQKKKNLEAFIVPFMQEILYFPPTIREMLNEIVFADNVYRGSIFN